LPYHPGPKGRIGQGMATDKFCIPLTKAHLGMKKHQKTLAPKTRQEIAHDMGISYSSLRRRIREECPDIPRRKLLSPLEVKQIYKCLGYSPPKELRDLDQSSPP